MSDMFHTTIFFLFSNRIMLFFILEMKLTEKVLAIVVLRVGAVRIELCEMLLPLNSAKCWNWTSSAIEFSLAYYYISSLSMCIVVSSLLTIFTSIECFAMFYWIMRWEFKFRPYLFVFPKICRNAARRHKPFFFLNSELSFIFRPFCPLLLFFVFCFSTLFVAILFLGANKLTNNKKKVSFCKQNAWVLSFEFSSVQHDNAKQGTTLGAQRKSYTMPFFIFCVFRVGCRGHLIEKKRKKVENADNWKTATAKKGPLIKKIT